MHITYFLLCLCVCESTARHGARLYKLITLYHKSAVKWGDDDDLFGHDFAAPTSTTAEHDGIGRPRASNDSLCNYNGLSIILYIYIYAHSICCVYTRLRHAQFELP